MVSRRKFLFGACAVGVSLLLPPQKAVGASRLGCYVDIKNSLTYAYDLGWKQQFESHKLPVCTTLEIDGADNIILGFGELNPIVLLNRSGSLLGEVHTETGGYGAFPNPSIAGTLFVTDRLNNSVVLTDHCGQALLRIGNGQPAASRCSIHFPFHFPTHVFAKKNGEFYIAEGHGGNRVHRFSSEGRLLHSHGASGSGNDRLFFPQAMADCPGDSSSLLVVDKGNKRVIKLNSERETFTTIFSQDSPTGICSLADKTLVCGRSGAIWILDALHSGCATILPLNECSSATSYPVAIATDSSGSIYLAYNTAARGVERLIRA